MSLSQRIIQVWLASGYTPPKIPLIFYENEYMITVDDSGLFLRFMSSDGQIFLALNQNCQLGTPDITVGNSVYVCSKVDPILCSPSKGPNGIRDIFVLNNITPLLT
jgi:hypothetical protein